MELSTAKMLLALNDGNPPDEVITFVCNEFIIPLYNSMSECLSGMLDSAIETDMEIDMTEPEEFSVDLNVGNEQYPMHVRINTTQIADYYGLVQVRELISQGKLEETQKAIRGLDSAVRELLPDTVYDLLG